VIDDEVVATAVDPHGDVVAVTLSEADPGGCRTIVSKRDGRTGAAEWRRELDACQRPSGAVAVDARGDVVVGTWGFVLVKLAGRTGEVLWRSELDPAFKWSSGAVNALAVDGAGDVVAAGDGIFNPFDDEDHDFLVEKVDGKTGERRWHFALEGEFPPCPPEDYCEDDVSPFDWASAVAIGPMGRVFVAGFVDHYEHGGATLVALNGSDGAEIWRAVKPGEASALLATRDAVYLGGNDGGGATVVRFDVSTGRELWATLLDGAGSYTGALSLHASGDLLAAGMTAAAGHVFVVRLDTAVGRSRWRRDLDAPIPGSSGIVRLTAARNGTVTLAAGLASFDPFTSARHYGSTIARLDLRGGDVLWQVSLAGTDAGEGRARALAAVGDDVVVAGSVRNLETNLDAAVTRLRGADGTEVWRVGDDGQAAGADTAQAVATDAAGDVFAVGTVRNAQSLGAAELAIVKLARRTGEERWRREIGATAWYGSGNDTGTAVAVDSTGDPIVGGQLANDFDFDGMVARLDGASGDERWRTLLRRGVGGRHSVSDVLVDAHDDVLALAHFAEGAVQVPTLVKLGGTDGAELWDLPLVPAPSRSVWSAEITLRDDTLIAAVSAPQAIGFGYDAVLVSVAGDSGAERWRHVVPDALALDVGVDALGRVVVGLGLDPDSGASRAVVLVLDPATGAERRRTDVTPPGATSAWARRLAFDASGGLATATYDAGFVTRLDPAGRIVWRRSLVSSPAGQQSPRGHVADLAIATDGTVVAALGLVAATGGSDWTLVGLGARSGLPRWRRLVDGNQRAEDTGATDRVYDLTLTPQDDAIAVGDSAWKATGTDFTVLGVRARNGREPRPVVRNRRAH
jgi:outer membrane protein assembly factor BamB